MAPHTKYEIYFSPDIINIFIFLYLFPGGGDAAVHGAVPGRAVVLAAHQLARTLAVPVTVALRVTYCGQLRGISTTHLALGAGGRGGAACPVVVCGAAAGGRVRRAAVHRAVARRAVVVAAVEIARALSVIVAVTLAWKYYLSSLLRLRNIKNKFSDSTSPDPDHRGWRLSSRSSHCPRGCRWQLVLWLWLLL